MSLDSVNLFYVNIEYELNWISLSEAEYDVKIRKFCIKYSAVWKNILVFCVNTFTPIDPLCRSKMTWIFPWDVLCRSFKLWCFRCHITLLGVCSLQKWKILEFLRWSEKTASKKVDLIKSYSMLNILFSSANQSLYSWLY